MAAARRSPSALLLLLAGLGPCAAFQGVRQAIEQHGNQVLAHEDEPDFAVGSGWTDTYDASAFIQEFIEVRARNGSTAAPRPSAPRDFAASAQEVRRRLEELTAAARNTTGGIVSALQLAAVVAELRQLRRSGRSPHLQPSVHVARKRGAAARAPPLGAEALKEEEALFGDLRRWIAFGGTGLALLSVLLTANQKKLMLAALSKAKGRREALVAESATEDPHESGGPKDLDVWDGTVATFSCLVGTGLLAMPYAFSLAGMVAAPILVFFVGCSAYTANLLSWSMNQSGKFSLGALVEEAFGSCARKAVDIFMAVELWSYLLSSTVCGSLNVGQLTDELDGVSAVVAFALAVYLLSFVPTQAMTRVSVLSNVVFMICCGMFLLTGFMLPERAPASDVQLVKPQGLLSAAGILVFSPAGHSFYPAVIGRMKEPERFPQCVNRAYVAVLVLYLAVAVTGYWLFGAATQPSAVLNIGADLKLNPLPALGWMGGVAALGLVVKMLALGVLVLSTLVSTLQHAFADSSGKLPGGLPPAAVTPLLLATSTAVSIHFANDVARLLNLMGSVFCMNIAFVLPVLCYWKSARQPVGAWQACAYVSLVLMGGTFAVIGLISAV